MFASPSTNAQDFHAPIIRYAQCWEDADVMLSALQIEKGSTCLSIASGGENTLSMLVADPAKVVAIDMNQSQLACLDLKMAAFRCLTHCELLILVGSISTPHEYHRLFLPSTEAAFCDFCAATKNTADAETVGPSQDTSTTDGAHSSAQLRITLYRRCRKYLSVESRIFWDARTELITRGIGAAGRFENYFKIFREKVMPLIHRRSTVDELLASKTLDEQKHFYTKRWNSPIWQLMFRMFFSRRVMAALGRSDRQFEQVHQPVAERILERTARALQHVPTDTNPYLRWILTGKHETALPHALRRENFDKIKANIDKIELRCCSVEEALTEGTEKFDRMNLSDVFEYMSREEHQRHLRLIFSKCGPRSRLVYWNMLAPRRAPKELSGEFRSLDQLSSELFQHDRAFFYSDLVIEELGGTCSVTSRRLS